MIVVQENVFVSEIFPGFATLSVNRLKGIRDTLLAKTGTVPPFSVLANTMGIVVN